MTPRKAQIKMSEENNKDQVQPFDKSQSFTVEECRKILGPDYAGLSDAEIDRIRIAVEILADITIHQYKQKKTEKNQSRNKPVVDSESHKTYNE